MAIFFCLIILPLRCVGVVNGIYLSFLDWRGVGGNIYIFFLNFKPFGKLPDKSSYVMLD